MIILVQRRHHTEEDKWEDMLVPMSRDHHKPVVDAAEFAEELRFQGLDGYYRAYMDDGSIWRITIRETIVYTAEIVQQGRDRTGV